MIIKLLDERTLKSSNIIQKSIHLKTLVNSCESLVIKKQKL